MSEPAQRPLEVPVGVRELPPRAVELRQAAVDDDARNEEVARPRIEAHIATCRMVADVLQGFHEQIADARDLELDGYSRPAAIWLVTGRCLGLLHAVLVQIAAGICTEALVTARSLHEANRLVFIFTQAEGEDLLRVWLDDAGRLGYVKPGQARAAEGEFEEMLNRVLDQKGMPTIGKTTDFVARMYDMLSRTAHNRRSSCLDSVWLPARQMAYGYHPSAVRRAAYTSWAAAMTIETIDHVGDAIGLFFSAKFYDDKVKPLRQSIEAIEQAQPLDERSIREAAGTLDTKPVP